MNPMLRVFLIVLVLVSIHAAVFATPSGTMRCSGGIVSIGDTTGEVQGKCGQPASTSQRQEKRVEEGDNRAHNLTFITTTVDDWTYNFGPSQFQYQLIFENGKVTRIESLGYGY